MIYAISEYYRTRFGGKVMRIPINIPASCPGRCTYCAPEGAGFEAQDSRMPIKEQIEKNIAYIGKKYNTNMFCAYFQNWSNTYMSADKLKGYLLETEDDRIVEMSIATRPDCISDTVCDILKETGEHFKRDMWVELGLQSINRETLKKINRGHGTAEFIDAVLRLKARGIKTMAHVILDLPWDTHDDVTDCAKFISALRVEGVKLHSLYIPKGSAMEAELAAGEFTPLEDYACRAAEFLAYLSPDCVVARLTGRIPQEKSAYFAKWWTQSDDILKEMTKNGWTQGCKCDYLNGAALKRLNY